MLKQIPKYSLLVLFIVTGLFSCREIPVDQVDYRREILNYINNSLDGKELYSTDLYPQDVPFEMDESGDLYYYKVNNVSRDIYISNDDLNQPPREIYPFGLTRDATAAINDDFEGAIYRIRSNGTTLAYKFESKVQRFAYFIKMYGDTYQYHGWRFWAYSDLNYSIDGEFASDSGFTFSARQTIIPPDLPSTRLGGYFVVEDFIAKLPLGDSITFSSNYYHRLFCRDRSDKIRAFNTILNDEKYKTGWQIPLSTDIFYQLITFDSDESGYHFKVDTLSGAGETLVVESTLVKRGDYVIPFKVDI